MKKTVSLFSDGAKGLIKLMIEYNLANKRYRLPKNLYNTATDHNQINQILTICALDGSRGLGHDSKASESKRKVQKVYITAYI